MQRRPPTILVKSTISQDKASTSKSSLIALKDTKKSLSLKGGRFESGIGKESKGGKSNTALATEIDPRGRGGVIMEEVD